MIHSKPRKPRTNGQIERHNAWVKKCIQRCLAEGKDVGEIELELRHIIAIKNTTTHSTTKCIPHEIHKGRLLDQPVDRPADWDEKQRQEIEKKRQVAGKLIQLAAEKEKTRWATKKGATYTFSLWEKVLVKIPDSKKKKRKIAMTK